MTKKAKFQQGGIEWALKKIEPKEGDLLVLKGGYMPPLQLNYLRKQLDKYLGYEVNLMYIREDQEMKVELWDEEKLLKHGWVRKKPDNS